MADELFDEDVSRGATPQNLAPEPEPVIPSFEPSLADLGPLGSLDPAQYALERANRQQAFESEIGQGPLINRDDINTGGLNRIIANSENPYEEAAKVSSSKVIARALGADPRAVYQNLEEIAQIYYGRPMGTFDNLWTTIKKEWDVARSQVKLGRLYNQLILGNETPELLAQIEEIETNLPTPEDYYRSLPAKILRTTATVAPHMLSGMKTSLLAGAVGFGVAAVGALTLGAAVIPAAMAGYAITSRFGAFAHSLVVESGLAYKEFSEYEDLDGNKVDPAMAKAAARMVGILNGSIEVVQLSGLGAFGDDLAKAFGKASKSSMTKGLMRGPLLRYAARTATGSAKEGAEEAMQEIVNIIAGETVQSLSGMTPEESDHMHRILDSFTQAALGTIALGIPGNVRTTVQEKSQFAAEDEAARVEELIDSVTEGGDDVAAAEAELSNLEKQKAPESSPDLFTEHKTNARDGSVVSATFTATDSKNDQIAAEIEYTGDVNSTEPVVIQDIEARSKKDAQETYRQLASELGEAPVFANTTRGQRAKDLISDTPVQNVGTISELKTIDRDTFQLNLEEAFPNLKPAEVDYALAVVDARAARLGTTTDEWVRTYIMEDAFVAGAQITDKRAAARFIDEGNIAERAAFYVTEGSDFTSFVHEMGHVIRRQLSAPELTAIENHYDHYGIVNKIWTRDAEEAFARDWEQYMRDGELTVPDEVKGIFQRLQEWFRELIDGVALKLPTPVREVFDGILGESTTIGQQIDPTPSQRPLSAVQEGIATTKSGLDSFSQALAEAEAELDADIASREELINTLQAELEGAESALNPHVKKLHEISQNILDADKLLFQPLKQAIPTDGTSQNQTPRTFRTVNEGVGWQKGTVNLDIGAGKYGNFTDALAGAGVENISIDPYALGVVQNAAAIQRLREVQNVDTATINNVLNTIPESDVRDLLLQQAARALKEDGAAYIKIYQGNKSGEGRRTGTNKFQNHRRTQSYIPEVKQFFNDVTRDGEVIIARSPKPQSETPFFIDRETELLYQPSPGLDTPEYAEYKEGVDERLLDEDGNMKTLYHGTLAYFTSFDPALMSAAAWWGAGVYLTDNATDASRNYGLPTGQDQIIKTFALLESAEELAYEDKGEFEDFYGMTVAEWDQLDFEEKRDALLVAQGGHGGAVLPVFAALKKPFAIDEGRWDVDVKWDEDGNVESEEFGQLGEFVQAMADVWDNYDMDNTFEQFQAEIMESAIDNLGIDVAEAMGIARKFTESALDNEGLPAYAEVVRSAIEQMGYDGIIMKPSETLWGPRMGLGENDRHYIVFDPKDIKSKFNRGTFDTSTAELLFQDGTKYVEPTPAEETILFQTKPDANFRKDFVETLSPEAREVHDWIQAIFKAGSTVKTGKNYGPDQAASASAMFDTAERWNEYVTTGELLNNPGVLWRGGKEVGAAIGAVDIPADIKERMGLNDDGTVDLMFLDTEYKLKRSMTQRLLDALPMEQASTDMEIDGRMINVNPRADTIQNVGGEGYRRAMIAEVRRKYAEGKLGTHKITGSHNTDKWGTMSFLQFNSKTIGSGDFTTICPQLFFNRGCKYCYRTAALRTGANVKLAGGTVWYTGEILRIDEETKNHLNRIGGLRIQSFGDWMPQFSAMFADMLSDAQTIGLQIKIITKEPDMVDVVAHLKKQGLAKSVNFNISADYVAERPAPLGESSEMQPINPARPFIFRDTETGREIFWKRAQTVAEGTGIRQENPWVNVRIVALTEDEFIRGLADPRVHVVTGYHGDIRSFERIDTETGELVTEVEPLGDSGMPRFLPDGTFEFRDKYGNVKTQKISEGHIKLAERIQKEGLINEYWAKVCCITGKCITCKATCGVDTFADKFAIQQATNPDPESVDYWTQNALNQPGNSDLLFQDTLDGRDRQTNLDLATDVLFQTEEEWQMIRDSAADYETWEEFRDFMEATAYGDIISEEQNIATTERDRWYEDYWTANRTGESTADFLEGISTPTGLATFLTETYPSLETSSPIAAAIASSLEDGSDLTSTMYTRLMNMIKADPQRWRVMHALAKGDAESIEATVDVDSPNERVEIARQAKTTEGRRSAILGSKTVANLRERVATLKVDLRKTLVEYNAFVRFADAELKSSEKVANKELRQLAQVADRELAKSDKETQQLLTLAENDIAKIERRAQKEIDGYSRLAEAEKRTAIKSAVEAAEKRLKEKFNAINDVRRERNYILKKAKQISAKVPLTIHLPYRQAIEAIQDGIDPHFRSAKTLERFESIRAQIDRGQITDDLIQDRNFQNALKKNLSEMTASEIEAVAAQVKRLKDIGRSAQALRVAEVTATREKLMGALINQLLTISKPADRIGLGSSEEDRALKKGSLPRKFDLAFIRPNRLLRTMDGGEPGAFIDNVWDRMNDITDAATRERMVRFGEMNQYMEELGLKPADMFKRHTVSFQVDGKTVERTYSTQDAMFFYLGMKQPETLAALLYGNQIPETALNAFVAKLTMEEKKFAEFLQAQFDGNYQRLRDAYVADTNKELGKVTYYVPMRRTEITGDPYSKQIAQEYAQRSGLIKAYPSKQFTKARNLDIPEEYQNPVRTDLYQLAVKEIEAQEHYIASWSFVKDFQWLMGKPEFLETLNGVFSPDHVKWLQKYVNDFANPSTISDYQDMDKMTTWVTSHMATSYLSYSLSLYLQQAASLPAFVGFTSPIRLMTSSAKYFTHMNEILELVKDKAPQVFDRKMDQTIEAITQHREDNNWKRAVENFTKMGIKPAEVIDRHIAVIGWLAVYDEGIARGLSEEAAARKGLDAVLSTQAAARSKDLPQAYRGARVAKMFLVFSNQINQYYNILRSDIPNAIKTGHASRAMGQIVGLSVAMVAAKLVSDRDRPEADDPVEIAKWLISLPAGLTPLVGRDIESALNGFTPRGVQISHGFMKTVVGVAQGQWESALRGGGELTTQILGLPYSQPRRIFRAFELNDAWELVSHKEPDDAE